MRMAVGFGLACFHLEKIGYRDNSHRRLKSSLRA
jgi:hypothetical protein